jgi:molybdate transport system substrate-binding protein
MRKLTEYHWLASGRLSVLTLCWDHAISSCECEQRGTSEKKLAPSARPYRCLGAKDSPVDVDKLGVKALLEPSVRKIAIANPEHAPYGRATVAALKALNVYDQVASRLLYGENIVSTRRIVQSGAADVGILPLSLALGPQMRDAGRFWQVPLDAYPRIEQGGVILKSSKNLEMARSFRDFLLGDHGREVLEHSGFSLPGK